MLTPQQALWSLLKLTGENASGWFHAGHKSASESFERGSLGESNGGFEASVS